VIVSRERNFVDLIEAEETDPAMFFTDAKTALVASAQSVGHDDHFLLREYLVDPAIEERPDLDGDPEFLVHFTRQTVFWSFPGLETSSRQFPLTALILQEHDQAPLVQNPFYGDGNTVPPPWEGSAKT